MTIFIIEILTLVGVSFYIFGTIKEQSKLVEIFSGVLFSFGSLLLTSGIVYHHFWLHPELMITNVIVEPQNEESQNIAGAEFRTSVYRYHPRRRLPDNIHPKKEGNFWYVKSTSRCSKLRVSTDVSNIGGSEMVIHEYTVKELKPTDRLPETYAFLPRETLPNQKRKTIEFFYPNDPSVTLGSGEYEFKIEVTASTQKKARRVKIIVSDDLMTIKWQEHDC